MTTNEATKLIFEVKTSGHCAEKLYFDTIRNHYIRVLAEIGLNTIENRAIIDSVVFHEQFLIANGVKSFTFSMSTIWQFHKDTYREHRELFEDLELATNFTVSLI